MKEIFDRLWVGAQTDYDDLVGGLHGGIDHWAIVHAAKEPYHREVLGYTGRAAPKDHPEYLIARRDNRLILNLVDTPDPKYVSREIVDAAVQFIGEHHGQGRNVLCHCNQGRSRSPTIMMLYLASQLPAGFDEAEEFMRESYPAYEPANGMREFAREHWAAYRGEFVPA
jgi:predicted protein tyrosine phosphatase